MYRELRRREESERTAGIGQLSTARKRLYGNMYKMKEGFSKDRTKKPEHAGFSFLGSQSKCRATVEGAAHLEFMNINHAWYCLILSGKSME